MTSAMVKKIITITNTESYGMCFHSSDAASSSLTSCCPVISFTTPGNDYAIAAKSLDGYGSSQPLSCSLSFKTPEKSDTEKLDI